MTIHKQDWVRLIRQEVKSHKRLLVALYGGDGPEVPDEVRKASEKLLKSAERAIKSIQENK